MLLSRRSSATAITIGYVLPWFHVDLCFVIVQFLNTIMLHVLAADMSLPRRSNKTEQKQFYCDMFFLPKFFNLVVESAEMLFP